jgi:two-component system, chemotaxis family, response regulator WspR
MELEPAGAPNHRPEESGSGPHGDDAALEAARRALPAHTATSDTAVVLLVDDQPIVREAVRQALAGETGIELRYCQHAAQALDTARQTRPTLILQDLVMPEIDGLTLVQQYRRTPELRDVPIIVLSTKEEPRIKQAAFEAGANDYLIKLPDRVELVARIRYHSRAYVNLLQLNTAYRALRQSQEELLIANRELERLSQSDGLTSLPNRRYLDTYLDGEWRKSLREGAELSMLMIDVDRFKQYNDTYGHVAGDDVLRQVGAALQRCMSRPGDLAARFGGEEFGVVLPGTPAGGARLVAEKIRLEVAAMQVPHSGGAADGIVTVSIGGACTIATPSGSTTALIEAADAALYQAKRGGRNRAVISA